MLIRPERPADYGAIYDLVKTAFATAKVSDGTEQDFVKRLRISPGYIPELALVAEEAGALIGHVMLTKIPLLPAEPGRAEEIVLLLAPLCVRLEERDKGVGAALVNEVFARARALGFTAVFLAGDPAYYGRFGFAAVNTFGIQHGTGIPDQYVLARELAPGALAGAAGGLVKIM